MWKILILLLLALPAGRGWKEKGKEEEIKEKWGSPPPFARKVVIDQDIFVGDAVTEERVQDLRSNGFRSAARLFDPLRGIPHLEIAWFQDAGLILLPLSLQFYSLATAKNISDAIGLLPKPVFIYDQETGYDATGLALAHIGLTSSPDQYTGVTFPFDRAADLGVNLRLTKSGKSWTESSNGDLREVILASFPDKKMLRQYLRVTGFETGKGSNWWVRRLTEDYDTCGQPSEAMLIDTVPLLYKTFLDFRLPGETGGTFPYIPNEAEILEARGVVYVSLPVDSGKDFTEEIFNRYYPIIINATKPVLGKCRSGSRSIAFVLLALAKYQNQNSSWFLDQARRQGFYFGEVVGNEDLVQLARLVLDGDTTPVVITPPENTKLRFLAPTASTWWIKQISLEHTHSIQIFAGGLPFTGDFSDERFIDSLVLDKFASVVCLWYCEEGWPAQIERDIVQKKGLQFRNYNPKGPRTLEMAKEFSQLISSLPQPIYVHCGTGWGSTSFVMTHLGLGSDPADYTDWKEENRVGWALGRLYELGYHYERQQGDLFDRNQQSFYEGTPWPNQDGDFRAWILQAFNEKL